MAHACTHVHRHAHTTQHMNTAHSQVQRRTCVPTCTLTFSHMQKHTQANGTLTNIHVHRPVLTETHSHMCRHIHLCTHTHRHTLAWLVTERGYLSSHALFQASGLLSSCSFSSLKKKSSSAKLSLVPQGMFFPIASSITPPILGPKAKSFHFKEKSLSPNWAAPVRRPVWQPCFAHLSLMYRKVTQSSQSIPFQETAKWWPAPSALEQLLEN